MTTVHLEAIHVVLGTTRVLDGLDLQVPAGELCALLGASGSGKTTVLRVIAGFVRPQRGRVLLDGEDVAGLPPQRRQVGMVYQSYALFPHLTVAQNVAFGLEARRTPRAEVARRTAEALELVRLQGLERRLPRQLSGGQQQRVALARTLVVRPRVLLLDEPLAALDKQLRAQMQIELRQLQREVGITTLFVTHDQEEALTLADRVALLADGRVLQAGPPHELYERPASRYVAEFLGRASLFAATVAAQEADGVALTAPFGLVRAVGGQRPPVGREVVVAVRPEQVRVSAAPLELPNCYPATAAGQVYLGAGVLLRLQLAAGVTLLAQVPADAPPAAGAAVYVGWAPERSIVLEQ